MSTILLIDDEKEVREVLGRFLNALGYKTLHAGDGLDGLEKTRATRPDLIVVDIQMPGMNGLQFCSVLKGDAKLKHIPVLFLSGEGSMGMAEEALRDGADGYLTKPLDFQRLKVKIEKLLSPK